MMAESPNRPPDGQTGQLRHGLASTIPRALFLKPQKTSLKIALSMIISNIFVCLMYKNIPNIGYAPRNSGYLSRSMKIKIPVSYPWNA
jgi:hypothetical protein